MKLFLGVVNGELVDCQNKLSEFISIVSMVWAEGTDV